MFEQHMSCGKPVARRVRNVARQDGSISQTSAKGSLEDPRDPNVEGPLFFVCELSAGRSKLV